MSTSTQSGPELSGYVLVPLREGAEFTLYRGWHDGNPLPVLVLAPAAEHPSPQSLRRLEHEYSLAAEVDPAWAAKPLALTRHEGRTALVLKDPGGEPLDRILERGHGQPPDLTRALRIAIGLTTALGQVHRHGLIHKDIKPENVLVDDANSVWLTGFGIASRLPRERQPPAPPEFIAGTLAYMAPEQTGRMNRSIDARSDLYALGVMLYEMITGSLPFTASDPMEWVHCHIARQAVPPHERSRNVPIAVSAIIMKLLAKTPEERYQTAPGAERDLRRCLEDWYRERGIHTFALGEHDRPDRLLIPEKLYGREREIGTLLASFDRVVESGTPELILVSGYSGIGKSSVVNELHKVLVPPRGLFASGKFDQYKRDIPYATLVQAFQSLLRPLLAKSEAELSKWRDALRQALDPNGQLIVDLVPELRLIIGDQPAVPELPPQDARSRFHMVFRRFISVFDRPEHPLALFLDDLQWLDPATLDLIEAVLSEPNVSHLMLIGAYRDNEVDPTHPLMRKLQAIRQTGVIVRDIVLAPLAREDIEQLIVDTVHCEPDRAKPLAQLVEDKTGGNPFFAIRFIVSLAEEGLLAFDHGEGRWSWDLSRIRSKGYTDNVVDLMVGKLRRLRQETQSALQHLACLGHTADIAMLAELLRTSEERVHADLWEAVRLEIVERPADSYRFVHDRIQEAAYSLIPEESRAGSHLRIGRLLAAHTPPEKREEAIFEIVNQLNRANALITSPDEREQVAELNLIAGKRAKASTAYASALNYLTAGLALLPVDSWGRRHTLMFELTLNRAECEFLTGALTEAQKRLTELSHQATNTAERAIVACLHIDVWMTLAQAIPAIAVTLEYLRHVGIDWPPHPTEEEARREYERISAHLGGRAIESVIDLPRMSDPESIATVEVLTQAFPSALYTDGKLLSRIICRAINLSLEHGNCDASCLAYITLGGIAGPLFGDYQAGYQFGQLGYDLVERRGFKRFQARAYMNFSICVVAWTSHVRSCTELVRRAFEAANKNGDLATAAYCRANLIVDLFFAGDPLSEVQREAEHGLAFAQKAQFGFIIDLITAQLVLIQTLRGLTPRFGCFSGGQIEELQFEHHLTGNPALALAQCWYWIRKLQARYMAGDYLAAMEASAKAQRLLWTSSGFLEEVDYHFYTALSRAASCDTVSPDQRQQHLEALALHQRQLDIWAQNCPQNFETRAALVGAEIARIEGRLLDAEQLYEKAIRSAHENGFVHNEAISYEVAARLYAARGFQKFADAYLLQARYCYQRWGAAGKVAQLDHLYPQVKREEPAPGPTSTIEAPVRQLEVETVVKASQALSSEIALPKLIESLLRIAIEHAGAERGVLILLRGDEPHIEAEATTGHGRAAVTVRRTAVTPSDLPQSALHYVIRTRERVLLDDASVENLYSEDEYVRQRRPRSVLCVPIIKQTRLVGALYLENTLTPRVFTSDRVTVLELLASQAAISLENASLYSDLQRSEAFLAEGQSISHTGSFGWSVAEGEIYWSAETYDIFEHDRAVKPTLEMILQRIHAGDRDLVQQTLDRVIEAKADFDLEHRLLMRDGSVKHVRILARALTTSSGNLEYVGAVTDVTAARQAEEKLRQSEREARQLLDLSPIHISELGPDGTPLFCNQAALDYYGITLKDWQSGDLNARLRDAERTMSEVSPKIQIGSPFEIEVQLIRRDGQYRWFHYRINPMRNEQGRITRWYSAGTDIEDRKVAEKRLQDENLALREEIDKASMFEEIVGISAPLQMVFSHISKVAPTDSNVLITGETGTGKELVARATHRRSRRSSYPFVSVNCAAVPRDLIYSELFGHEKGAFTGATQRRSGRFELAERGTIFLDEIGELPAETQIALLRVLQEHEFERVGGTGSIRTDVRVIAATNRDLEAAIAAGTFRSDLFYRLNVFPIEMPPLRERREDIPMLVEYFIDRYARKAGKSFQAVNKKSLDLLQSYPWPGNIRELQNVVERSVVVCETDVFSVDERWLSSKPHAGGAGVRSTPFRKSPSQEKAIIEAALLKSAGRVAGAFGAATKLGVPRSTLESKIRSLKIDKDRFKNPDSL